MSLVTIAARKFINVHMLSNNLKPETVEVNNNFVKAANGIAEKWKQELEENQNKK